MAACLLALLLPAWVFALNLGDITLKSAPGEPLEAEIPLSGVSADDQERLSVGLADVAGFRWAGIEWTPALSLLQFELRRGADGVDHIRVYSAEALQLPVLHFLLKVAWSRGRLFREYALELDTSPYNTAPTLADGAPGDDRQDTRESRRYEVTRDDTLWGIARALRPDSSISIQQTMLALLRANPGAFSRNNINWLKAGATLWMPSDFELQALSAAEAFAEVLAQNNGWREARGLPTVAPGWLADTGTSAADAGLRLVAVSAEGLEEDDVAAVAADGTSREQEQERERERELALANEQVEGLSQENVELQARLSEAETIIDDLRRLVELKDDELAALQAQTLSEQGGEPGPDLVARAEAAYDAAIEALGGAKMKSIHDGIKAYWQLALAGLAALLVLAGWWLLRKKPGETGAHKPDGDVDGSVEAAPGAHEAPPDDETPEHIEAAGQDLTGDVKEGEEDAARDTDPEAAEAHNADEPGDADAGTPTGLAGAEPATAEVAGAEDGMSEQDTAAGQGEEEAYLEEGDRVQNKIDLARAYLELGDSENARTILDEVLSEGNAGQREEARQLLAQANAE